MLFICVENACRSLMAEAIFNANPPPGWHARSAGTLPAAKPNPRVPMMLEEIGLSVPDHPPRLLTNEMMTDASIRVTMGCLDSASCPARLRSMEVVDWALPDPARLDDIGFRGVRDSIRDRVNQLVREIVARERALPQNGRPNQNGGR